MDTGPTKKDLQDKLNQVLSRLDEKDKKLDKKRAQKEAIKSGGAIATPEPVVTIEEEDEQALLKMQAELLEAQKDADDNIASATKTVNTLDDELKKLDDEKNKLNTTSSSSTTPPPTPGTGPTPPPIPDDADLARPLVLPDDEPEPAGSLDLGKLEADEQRRMVLMELAREAVGEANQQIAYLEMGPPPRTLPEQEKVEVLMQVYREKIEDSQKDRIKESGFSNFIEKGQNWWASLDKTTGGKIAKVAMSTTLIGGAALLTGSITGIGPGLSTLGTRLATRVGIATGVSTIINMAMASNMPKKVMGWFRGGNENDISLTNENTGLKKHLTLGNAAMALGVGTVFLISGPAMGIVAAGGIGAKKLIDYISKKVIDAQEKKKEEIIEEIDSEVLNASTEDKLEFLLNTGMEYDRIEKGLNKRKAYASLAKGLVTFGAGLASMEVHAENPNQGIFGKHAERSDAGKTEVITEEEKAIQEKEVSRASISDAKEKFDKHTGHDETFVKNKLAENEQAELAKKETESTSPSEDKKFSEVIAKAHEDLKSAKTEEVNYTEVKAGDGVTQTLKAIQEKGETPKWFTDAVGEKPSPKDWARFAEKIGVYNSKEVNDSLNITSADSIGFDKNGNLLIERGGVSHILAKPDGKGGFVEGDWKNTMTDEKFIDAMKAKVIIEKPNSTDMADNVTIKPIAPEPNTYNDNVYRHEDYTHERGGPRNSDTYHNDEESSVEKYRREIDERNKVLTRELDERNKALGASVDQETSYTAKASYGTRGSYNPGRASYGTNSEHIYQRPRVQYENESPKHGEDSYPELNEKALREVEKVFDAKIEKIFPDDEVYREWSGIKDSRDTNANTMMYMDKEYLDDKNYIKLQKYLIKLRDHTGLEPKTIKDGYKENETTSEYMHRALQRAAQMGILKKFK